MSRQQADDIRRILQEMREEYWQSIEADTAAPPAASRDLLVFCLGGERFAIPTGTAREVLKIPRLIRVPQVPPHIRGVINLRGQIVAVTDLAPLLGLQSPAPTAQGRLLLVEAAQLTTALLVEAVEGIRSVAEEAIEPLTANLRDFPAEAVTGQVADDQGLLVLLDLEQILSRPEFVIDQQGSTAL